LRSQTGEEASITSCGAVVAVHANAYEVDNYLTGGEQLIELVKLGADRSGNGRPQLINPKRSLALLRARMENRVS
jgi:hypothetical protein